jgi:DNA topoisomerase-1
MKLLIVESPAKAKTIEKYLKGQYVVKASIGHVRDLPKNNKKAIDIEGGFVPHYEVSAGKEHVLKELATLAKKSSEVLLATDPDREGEAIAWHLFEALDLPKKTTKRVTFNEITEEAVKQAVQSPRGIDQNLRKAQEARRVLDRLVGYDLSGLVWKKVRYGLSAGRVQSPALRIVMEREREIRAFVPVAFWVITAHTHTKKKEALPLVCIVEPATQAATDEIVSAAERGTWKVIERDETPTKRAPRPPFTTSTLQQAASSRLGYSPSVTMRLAQKLYEAGHITYMRTDSVTLSATAVTSITHAIGKHFGKDYAQVRTYETKSKNAQEAHEAIRPTHPEHDHAGVGEQEKKLYRLIWERTLASQMKDAQLLRTKIVASVGDPTPVFAATGSRVVYDGWLIADPRARGEDVELPLVTPGDTLVLDSVAAEAKETQPPSRYTEAGLIKELEKRGIGRPSTYAAIMRTLTERGYVQKEGRTLVPTATGDVVSTFLEDNFATYISDSFTAEMEDELDDIALGKREYEKTLREFYQPFHHEVLKKEKIAGKITDLGPAPDTFPCPLCGSSMVYKLGKTGKFMSCTRFPECIGARGENGAIISAEGAEPIGNDPESGSPIYVLTGRFGPYVQIGETPKKGDTKAPKPRRASIPAGTEPESVTLADALRYLSLPRTLGVHPQTSEPVIANTGRFGPYIAYAGDFRSLKKPDDPYTITLARALAIIAEPKKGRPGEKMIAEVGLHPKTHKMIRVYESKSGKYMKKGFRRIMLPDDIDLSTLTPEVAAEMLKQ